MKGSSVLSLVFTIFCLASLGSNVYGNDPSEAASGEDVSIDGQKEILFSKFNEFLNLLIALGASDSGSSGAQTVPEFIAAGQQQQQQQQGGQTTEEAAKQQQQQQQGGETAEEAAKQQQQQQQQQEPTKEGQQQQQQEGQKEGVAEQQQQEQQKK